MIFLSSACAGTLQTPPHDGGIRRHLVAVGSLSHESVPSDEVFHVMASRLRSERIIPKTSYNGRAVQYLNAFMNRLHHPDSRQ